MIKQKLKFTKMFALVGAMTILLGTVQVSANCISANMNSARTLITAGASMGSGSYHFTCDGWERHPTTLHEVRVNKTIHAGGSNSASVNFRTDNGYKFERNLHGLRLNVSLVFNSGYKGFINV